MTEQNKERQQPETQEDSTDKIWEWPLSGHLAAGANHPDMVRDVHVGMSVYYYAYGTPGGEFPAAVKRAAIITEVDRPGDQETSVGLAVLNPTGLFFNQHVPFGPGKPGHWSGGFYRLR